MKALLLKIILLVTVLVLAVSFTAAQEAETTAEAPLDLPASYTLNGFTYYPQMWNNCGPATMTMALSYFGYTDNQVRAANWLKPNGEDKNVSPWQMVEYVNTQVPELPVYATQRFGGTLETLKLLLTEEYPVIIEAGYDPPRAAQGWMGHYLLVVGYDDAAQMITTYDSYDGQNMQYTYEHIEEFWQHFNYTFIVLYNKSEEEALMTVLGDDADPYQNYLNAFELAREEATLDSTDSFAWFNMGSMLVELAKLLDDDADMYKLAADAYDQARNVGEGLPWRMLWYQFGPYEAYNAVGRYDDTIELARQKLNDGGGQYVEETFYYAGLARAGKGETQRALENFNETLRFNPNFSPAREQISAINGA